MLDGGGLSIRLCRTCTCAKWRRPPKVQPHASSRTSTRQTRTEVSSATPIYFDHVHDQGVPHRRA
eukprot:333458-Amphidinium_carterae.1